MTRYVLDTNVLSNITKPAPLLPVTGWLEAQVQSTFFVASFSLGEIERGILELPAGRKRDELAAWYYGARGPKAKFFDTILAFDERAAAEWARLMAEGTATGRPRSVTDMIIAATAVANGCTVATLNDRDFRGAVATFNPMTRR